MPIRAYFGLTHTLSLLWFVSLKLGGLLGWPWVWVLCPAWMPLCGVLAEMLIRAIRDRRS